MRFSFTDDQHLFRDAVRDLLAKQCPPDQGCAARKRGDVPARKLRKMLDRRGTDHPAGTRDKDVRRRHLGGVQAIGPCTATSAPK